MYSKYCVHWPSLDKLWSQGSSLPYSPGIGLLVIGQRVQHLPSARRFWASNVPTRGLLEGNLKIMQFSAVLYQSTADNPPPPNKHESLTRWHSTINVEDIYIYMSAELSHQQHISLEWSCSLISLESGAARWPAYINQAFRQSRCVEIMCQCFDSRVSRRGKRSAGWRFNNFHNRSIVDVLSYEKYLFPILQFTAVNSWIQPVEWSITNFASCIISKTWLSATNSTYSTTSHSAYTASKLCDGMPMWSAKILRL